MTDQEACSVYALHFAGESKPVYFRAVTGSVKVTAEGKLEHKDPSDGRGPFLVSVNPMNINAIVEHDILDAPDLW